MHKGTSGEDGLLLDAVRPVEAHPGDGEPAMRAVWAAGVQLR